MLNKEVWIYTSTTLESAEMGRAITLLQSRIPFIKGFFVSQLLRSLASIQQMSNKLQFDLVVAGIWK